MKKEDFAELVVASTDSLYRVAKGILRQDAECEDAVWEAVAVGFEKLDTLKEDRYAKTWLIRILIHECYRILRRHKKVLPLETVTEKTVAESAGGRMQDYSELYAALQTLGDAYRTAVILFYIEGFSIKEIAEITDASESSVKSRLHRARRQLRKLLEQEEGILWN